MRSFAVGWCIAVCSCWGGNSAQQTAIGHPAPLAERTFSGAYWCSIQDDGFAYPPYPCAIWSVDHRLVLAKLGGSQRFEGEIKPAGAGFSFDGLFYCPAGDCTQPLHGTFEPNDATLVGRFRDSTLVVRLAPVQLGSAFGGASYGGASCDHANCDGATYDDTSYGGASYGGASYGGASYGGASYGGVWSGH